MLPVPQWLGCPRTHEPSQNSRNDGGSRGGGAGGVLAFAAEHRPSQAVCADCVRGPGSARAGGRAVWLDEADGVH